MGPLRTHNAHDPFHDEIREMLQRRAGDVPGSMAPTSGRLEDPPHRAGRAAFVLAAAAVVLIVAGVGLFINNAFGGGTAVEPVSVAGPAEGDGQFLAPPQAVTVDYEEAVDLTGGDQWFFYGPPDGDGTEGLVANVGSAPFGETFGPVTPDESEWLAAAGASYLSGPKVQVPIADDQVLWLGWYGQEIDQAGALTAAEALLDDQAQFDDLLMTDLPVPDGWDLLWSSETPTEVSAATFDLASGEAITLLRFPAGTPLMVGDYSIYLGYEASRSVVPVRGTQGLQVAIEGGGFVDSVVWQEGGFTWSALINFGETVSDDPLGLVEELQLVDLSTLDLIERSGSDQAADTPTPPTAGGVTGTAGPPPPETPEDPSTTHFDNVVSTVTAPGPGATIDDSVSTLTTVPGTDPSTTGPGPTGTGSIDPDSTTTSGPPPSTVYRPEGSFVEDGIYVVADDELAGRPYNVGVYWSSVWGFCVGAIFDQPASVGGFPAVCELDPRIGGGFYTIDPDRGAVLFVYTPWEVDAATLAADSPYNPTGAEQQGTLHQVPEFPEYTFAVFELEGVTEVSYPLYWVSLWNDGQTVGWG